MLTAVKRSRDFKPAMVPCSDVEQQSAFVASRILELRDEGTHLEDIAVMYRSHYHSIELQLELTRRGIPYRVQSGVRFFEQAHIKDVISYLRIIVNPRDELAWKRDPQNDPRRRQCDGEPRVRNRSLLIRLNASRAARSELRRNDLRNVSFACRLAADSSSYANKPGLAGFRTSSCSKCSSRRRTATTRQSRSR